MSRYTSATDADRAGDARARSASSRSTSCSPTSRRACGSAGRSTCPPGKPEQEVYAHLRELAARNVSAEDELSLPRRRDVRPLRAGADRLDPAALGVPDAVHALPARDLPGRAAGDVRVPDGDLRADRPAGLQRVASTRARARVAAAGYLAQAAQQAARASSSRAACTRTARETLATTAPAGARRSRRSRSRDGVTDADALAAALGDDVSAVVPRSSRTSSARSRTSRRSRRPPSEAGALADRASATRSRSACCARPATSASTSRVGEGQTLGNRLDFGGPSFGFFAAQRGATCAGCRAGSRARRPTSTAAAASCSRCRRASSTSAARRRPTTSAPRRRSTRSPASIYLSWLGRRGHRRARRAAAAAHRLRARDAGGARRRRAAARAAGRARVRGPARRAGRRA